MTMEPLPQSPTEDNFDNLSDNLIDGRYKIIRSLGSGLSGEVLAVSDQEGSKALKFLKRIQMNVSKEEALENFKNEFALLAELNHPNIGRILDFGLDSKICKYYFTTELIEGNDFFVATEGKSFEVIEDLAVQVLRALNYLHSRGIYHYDIKPQNILVAEKEGKLTAQIIDFGLAGFTNPKKKVGTPAYMAPEVIAGGVLDGRTDLYSFGVLLYKSLTRENPFADREVRETLRRQQQMVPPPPSQVLAACPRYWDQIVLRLLEKTPSHRYPQGSSVIRDINFLARKNYEIETLHTRLSYLPEKGVLVGRRKEMEIFKTLFEMIFSSNVDPNTTRLLIIEGKTGTGKTRLLSEFKYYSQLRDIPVYTWEDIKIKNPAAPFCLHIDETQGVGPEEVTFLFQQHAADKILILWATPKGPVHWSYCETFSLKSFSEKELTEYLTMVTGLSDVPKKLVEEIYERTHGNPLFVTELLKTMLANNMLLDESGRWASSTFEDIGINFEKIQVPHSLSGLLREKYESLKPEEKKILEWMTIMNRPVSMEHLQILSLISDLHPSLFTLTKEDLIERTDRDQHYFFANIMMRNVIYETLKTPVLQKMHDEIAHFLEGDPREEEAFFYHRGQGSHPNLAIAALEKLADKQLKNEKFSAAMNTMELASKKAEGLDPLIQIHIEEKLAECTVHARNYKKAIVHYEHLKEFYDVRPALENAVEHKMRIYEKLGNLYVKVDEYEKALDLFQQAFAWLENFKNQKIPRLLMQNHIANAYMKSGQPDKAEILFRQNQEVLEHSFTVEEKLRVTNNFLADVLFQQKKYDEAIRQTEKDVEFYQKIGDHYLLARSTYVQGDIYFKLMINEASKATAQAHRKKALAAFETCVKLAKSVDAHDLMLRAYNGIGNLHYHEQNYDPATDYYERALAIARKMEDFQTASSIALNLGNMYKMQKQYRDAYSYFVYVINTLESLPHKNAYNWYSLFNSHAEIAETHRELGELSQALEAIHKAEDIMKAHSHLHQYEFWTWLEKAKVYSKQKEETLFKEAFAHAESLAKDGFEIESLKKFRESLSSDDSQVSRAHMGSASTVLSATLSQTGIVPKDHPLTLQQLETILQINKMLNSEHDLEHLFKMVLNYALELAGAEIGLVLLIDEKGEFSVAASVNTVVNADLTRISTSVAHRSLETGDVIISSDALTDQRFDSSESVVLNELRSVLCLPLKSKNKTIGVLYLDNRYRTNAFANVNLPVLHAYVDQVGIALENARLLTQYEKIQKQLEASLEKTKGELEEVKEILKNETSVYLTRYTYSAIIAKSRPMQEVFKLFDKITETNLTVYLHGASGTGKELMARALHVNNPQRTSNRFVAINCGAIPANLMESELFGHKMGAFTGATKDKKGLFEEAHGGTLFLDEVADLDPPLQVKLLRVLQEGEVQRVGDVKAVKVDVRIVCASHKSLDALVKQGAFREDLFYRLCQIKIDLPGLCERKEDIPLLVDHFVEKFRKENKVKDKIKISPAFLKLLFQYPWPGNVRELENTVNVACALRNENTIEASSLPPNYGIAQIAFKSQSGGLGSQSVKLDPAKKIALDEKNNFDPSKTWEQYETLLIAKCLAHHDFKKNPTAFMLGISSATLYKKIKDFELENKDNPLFKDPFIYTPGFTLKAYIPLIFKAALAYADNHPYGAIRMLAVSQGYFYKIMKLFNRTPSEISIPSMVSAS